jgi:hypothetical protein
MKLYALLLAAILISAVIPVCTSFPLPKSVDAAHPGARVVMDAHNCYPYFGWWSDRIDRALSSGTPLAIEQDLFWFTDPKTGTARSLVTHGAPSNGDEPSMREYFFERIRPLIEKALKDGTRGGWPLITLNLDLKSEEPAHLAAIWKLLTEYREWITTAPRTTDIHTVAPLDVKPILVLTGESDAQKAVFHDQVPVGSALLVFGATPTHAQVPSAPPDSLAPDGADNYHRWWNNPWRVVESAGQANAGEWTPEKENRLHDLVRYAHQRGLWIRFYTLDGVSRADESCRGIFHLYNFGSRAAVEQRWHAAARAGVDYIATDQYEDLARLLRATNQSTTGALAFGADGNAAIRQLPHPES